MSCEEPAERSEQSEIEKELSLLARRWGKSLEVLGVQYEGDAGAAACFTLSMPPSDPDFPHDIGGLLKMTITLPVGYPITKPCEVVVTNDNLHPQIKTMLGKAIAKEASGRVGKIMVWKRGAHRQLAPVASPRRASALPSWAHADGGSRRGC